MGLFGWGENKEHPGNIAIGKLNSSRILMYKSTKHLSKYANRIEPTKCFKNKKKQPMIPFGCHFTILSQKYTKKCEFIFIINLYKISIGKQWKQVTQTLL